tara:strand:+ start:4317 stop:5510 length:1194 start_codon:yes stop_codon:yes gene_type:complete
VIFVPFNTLVFHNFLNQFVPSIAYWDEILIMFAGLLWLTSNARFNESNKEIVFISFLIGFYILAGGSYYPDGDWLNYIKVHMLPILIFFLALSLKTTPNLKISIMNIYCYVACFSVFFALIVAQIPETVLLQLGFKSGYWSTNALADTFFITGSDARRLSGGFAGPVPFSIYMLSALLLHQEYGKKNTIQNIIIYAILIFGLASSLTRSTLAIFMIVTFIFYWKNLFSSKRILGYTLMSLLLGAGIFFWIGVTDYSSFNYFSNEFQLIDNIINFQTERSAAGRLSAYPIAFNIFLESPIFGHGVSEYNNGSIGVSQKIENEYLASLIDLGVVGFFLYALFFITVFLKSKKGSFERKMLIALAISAFFFPLKFYYNLFILIFLIMGLSLQFNNEKRKT